MKRKPGRAGVHAEIHFLDEARIVVGEAIDARHFRAAIEKRRRQV